MVTAAPPAGLKAAPLPEKPSVLTGAPKQLLHALHEVCTEIADELAEASSAVGSSSSSSSAAALPTMDFAVSACFDELRNQRDSVSVEV